MTNPNTPVVLITGGSAGLGLMIAKRFQAAGYRVMIAGRSADRLHAAEQQLETEIPVGTCVADVSDPDQAHRMINETLEQFGRIDALINCVGMSDRGLAQELTSQRLEELFRQNVTTALLCSQAALGALEQSGGVIVNIGSLASKVGARYIGGYAAAKHALAGLTQQMRLELKPRGIHVALVNPGPIQRSDAGSRYEKQLSDNLPAQAAKPGAGTKVKGLPASRVAEAVLACVRHRKPDVILPGYLRLLVGIGNLFPRLGDWLLLKFTSSGDK